MCHLTAIVGVSKQKEKATGMLIETQIKFGKETLNNNSDNDHYAMFNAFGSVGGMMMPPPMAPMMYAM